MSNLVLVATVGSQRIAIDAARIASVVNLSQIVPVPLAPAHVAGIAAVRSRVLTVIDAAAAVGVASDDHDSRAIVVEVDGHRYALRVDAVHDVVTPTSAVAPFDPSLGACWTYCAFGTIDTSYGFALLVDPARIVGGPLLKAA